MTVPFSKQALSILPLIPIALLILFCNSCKKISNSETDTPPYIPTDTSKATIRDLTTKINSSVSGFVTDELSNAVNGAAVMVGSLHSITDKYGFFEIKNAQVVKEAAVITVVQPGYFKGIKTYIAKEGKSAFFRIQLIPKNGMGSIDAAAGGSITLSTGLGISIPDNAVVNANTNAAYKGQINIAAKYINPEGNDMRLTMPGDLRGLDSLGSLKLLTTYGMAAVELTGSAGELLQMAPGKKATFTFPISTSLASAAPSTIPLWYFDEANGLWRQQGFAIKSGNNYIGEVSHFSFWNCDAPADYVHFDCNVFDTKGNPIPGIWVKVSLVSNSINAGWGLTDSSGYTSGIVPNNSQLLMEVFSTQYCDIPTFSKTFTTSSANVSMENIVISNQNNTTVKGTVTNCNGLPVTNGYIIMKKDATNFRYPISNTGTFNFNTCICQTGNNNYVSLIAEDNNTNQTGDEKYFNLTTGDNAIGNVSVCGTSAMVPFNCILVNTAGNRQPNVWIKLSDLTHPQYTPTWSLADSSGFISRTLFENSQFLLEVFATRYCSSPVFSKNFSTSDTTTSLGNIIVNGINMATVSGTVTNCNGVVVSNGSVIMQKDGTTYRYPLSSTGTFSFTTPVCNTTNAAVVSLAAEDNSTLQLGNVRYDTLTAGNNVIGMLNTCFMANNSDQEFIIISIDSSTYSFVSPVDSFTYSIVYPGTPAEQLFFSSVHSPISPYENQRVNFSTGGIRGSIAYLWEFNVHKPNFTWDGRDRLPIPINITEYGDIGQFISGNFKLKVFEYPSSQDPISLKASCSFRIRRRQ